MCFANISHRFWFILPIYRARAHTHTHTYIKLYIYINILILHANFWTLTLALTAQILTVCTWVISEAHRGSSSYRSRCKGQVEPWTLIGVLCWSGLNGLGVALIRDGRGWNLRFITHTSCLSSFKVASRVEATVEVVMTWWWFHRICVLPYWQGCLRKGWFPEEI